MELFSFCVIATHSVEIIYFKNKILFYLFIQFIQLRFCLIMNYRNLSIYIHIVMKTPQKRDNRFILFLTSLCSPKNVAEIQCQGNKKKCKMKINKTPRLTYNLDRVLVKVSRKNVAEQQFMQNDVLTFHLEKHLANRLKESDIVIFSGEFSSFLTQRIPFSIELKSSEQQVYLNQSNYLLSNANGKLNLNFNSIDAMVFQLYYAQSQNFHRESQFSRQTAETKEKSQNIPDLVRMQEILRFYHEKIKSFIFICDKNLRFEDAHNLFLVFKQNYLFEFQRIKKIQKHVCNIVYVSNEPRFLKIDNVSLSHFIVDEFSKMGAFQYQTIKSTIKPAQGFQIKEIEINRTSIQGIKVQKGQLKQNQLLQTPKKEAFQELVVKMLQKNVHIHMTQALGTILDFPDKSRKKLSWFMSMMNERCNQVRKLTQDYRNNNQEKEEQIIKTTSQFTPIFAVRNFQSGNFQKVSALFKTHSSQDLDDLVLCNQQNHELD